MEKGINKFRQAAYCYVGGGILTVALTLLFIPQYHYRRGIIYLLPGIILLLIFGYLISKGYILLTRIIAMLAIGRTLLFALNFFLTEPVTISLPFYGHRIVLISGTGNWIFLIMAIITALIALMLIRAGWGSKS